MYRFAAPCSIPRVSTRSKPGEAITRTSNAFIPRRFSYSRCAAQLYLWARSRCGRGFDHVGVFN